MKTTTKTNEQRLERIQHIAAAVFAVALVLKVVANLVAAYIAQ